MKQLLAVKKSINDSLPECVRFGYGTFYIHTDRGQSFIKSLSEWKHVTKSLDFGVGLFIISMIGAVASLLFLVVSSLISPPEPTAAQDPTNLVVIPGVNEFLPVSATLYIIFALFVAAGVHELAHAVAMFAEDVEVKELGVATLLIIPIAAYVMPVDDDFEELPSRSQARILSAGVTANIGVAVLISILFLFPFTGSPITAFFAYFSSVFGTGVDVAVPISSISVLTNVLFWTWFFNINLAFVNVLPVHTLDGGRMMKLAPIVTGFSTRQSQIPTTVVAVTSVTSIGLFAAMLFIPLYFA